MRFISLGSNKGGVGKSTIAINLAASAAMLTEKKVLLIEADPGARSISLLMRSHFKPEKGWVDFIRRNAILEEVLVRSEVLENLYIIFSSSTIAFGEVKDKEAVAEQANLFKKLIESSGEYAIVVIDCPGKPSLDYLIYGTLTELYLVTGPNISEVKAVAEFRKRLNQKFYEIFNVETEVAKGIVVNFLSPERAAEDAKWAAMEIGLPVFAAIPSSTRVAESEKEGKPLVMLYPEDAASKAFFSIASKVMDERDISYRKKESLERRRKNKRSMLWFLTKLLRQKVS